MSRFTVWAIACAVAIPFYFYLESLIPPTNGSIVLQWGAWAGAGVVCVAVALSLALFQTREG